MKLYSRFGSVVYLNRVNLRAVAARMGDSARRERS